MTTDLKVSAEAAPGTTESLPQTVSATSAPAGEPVTTSARMAELLRAQLSAPDPSESAPAAATTPDISDETPGHEPSPDATEEDPTALIANDEPEPDPDPEPTPKPEPAQKRIDKLTAQKHELKAQLDAAQAKLQELTGKLQSAPEPEPDASTPAPSPNAPKALAQVRTFAELQAKQAEAEHLSDWADDQLIALRKNPAGVEHTLREAKVMLKDTDGQEDFSRESVEAFLLGIRKNTQATLRAVPQRAQFLNQQAHAEAAALQEFPWWSQPSSEEYGAAQQVLQGVPWVKERPDWKFIVGLQVLGLQELHKRRQAAAPKRAAPAAVAPKVSSRPAAVPRVDEHETRMAAAKERLLQGNAEDYVGLALAAAT